MKKVCQRIRTDLPKTKTFKLRNYKTPEQKGIIAPQIALEQDVYIAKNKAKEVIKKDCDFSGEEKGYFLVNGKVVKTFFPR